jgi:Ca2+-binding EF-hand superfamily protein
MTHEQEMRQERELSEYADKMREEFKEIDTNRDGVLTYKEIDDFMIRKVNF